MLNVIRKVLINVSHIATKFFLCRDFVPPKAGDNAIQPMLYTDILLQAGLQARRVSFMFSVLCLKWLKSVFYCTWNLMIFRLSVTK